MRYRGQRDEFDSMESKKWQNEDRPLRTAFHEILFSSLPEHEESVEYLTEDVVAVITAAEKPLTFKQQFTTYLAHFRSARDLRTS